MSDFVSAFNRRMTQDPYSGQLVIVNAPKGKRKEDLKLDLSNKTPSSTGFSDKSTVSVPKEAPAPKQRTRAEAATFMKERNAAPVPAPIPAPAPVSTPAPAAPTLTISSEPAPAATQETAASDNARLESLIFPEGVEAAPAAPVAAAPAPAPAMAEEAPVAKPVIDENRLMGLFRKTTGTAFDPQSKVDRARLEELTSFIEQDPERLNKSDTKIALDFYRTLK
jgi:hypothetical protein